MHVIQIMASSFHCFFSDQTTKTLILRLHCMMRCRNLHGPFFIQLVFLYGLPTMRIANNYHFIAN